MLSSWLLRGLVMAVVHFVARYLLGLVIIDHPLHTTVWKTITVAIVVFIALLWGGIDGLVDGRAHDDPDDYDDLTVRWLKAGVFAGVVAALVSYFVGRYFFAGIGQASFLIELFAGASFTALLVFAPAFLGAAVGRFLMRRTHRSKTPDDDGGPASDDAPTVQMAKV
ncbi:MAG: B-4DMT family transporter [Gordonia sp. (in: high G+C Gram-positive bacteria)]